MPISQQGNRPNALTSDVLADVEKARDIAQADPLRRVGAGAAYTANF